MSDNCDISITTLFQFDCDKEMNHFQVDSCLDKNDSK